MYYSCKLYYFPLLVLFSGSYKCMVLCPAVLSALASSAYLMFFPDKLNDDDDDDDDR